MSKAPVIVFGDSTSAVFLISQLLKRGEEIVWAKGSGARMTPVMPYLKSELALSAMLDSAALLGEDVYSNPIEKSCFHRVFKSKNFKTPNYKQNFEEQVWAPERLFLGLEELRVRGSTPAMLEESLRVHFESHEHIQHVHPAPVLEMEIYEQGGEIQFSNGFRTTFSQFYFCDTAHELKQIPKLATVLKHQSGSIKASQRMSALQVVFTHKDEMPYPQDTGFVIPMNRDAGEEFDRDVLGYFLDSKRSVWTVFMKSDEVEENHEIMKKLRKMKQSLNRAFGAETDSATEFSKTVIKEQVRFESGFLVVDAHTQSSDANQDFVLVSDSFGLSHSLEIIANRFEIKAIEFDPAVSGLVADIESVEAPTHLQADL